MNYKLEGVIRRNKKYFIIFVILWLFAAIVLMAPITLGYNEMVKGSAQNGMQVFMQALTNPFNGILSIIKQGLIGSYFKSLGGFTIVYSIFFMIGIFRSAPKHEYTDFEHGSSDWSKNGEQYHVLSNKKGIILAEDNYLPTDKRGNVNVLVVGGSGSGKSASYSIPNAFQQLGSYVFTDPKGELYDKTAGYLKENGYEIKILNLVKPQNSDGYNPLMHISSEIDVDVIANTIVKGQKTDGGGSDPFWDDSAEMLLKSLIYYLMATRPEEEQNLASCAELVRAANSSGGNNLLTELISKLPYDHPARMNYKSIEIAPEKTYSSILSTLQSKLGKFDSKEIAELTSTDTIDFESIGNKKTAVYVISSDTHTAYDFLLTIFFAQMIQQLYNYADENGGALKVPTYFILDEFANIGKVPDFDKKISTSRSRKISFSVILQNLDQLEAVYEKSYETIIGNCDTHVFLGSNSYKTVEYFSKALGEKTIDRNSISVNKDRQYFRTGQSISDQVMARALMTPDELRRMDNDLCIIFEKGIKPVKANKFYYFKNKKMVNELKRSEISHNNVGEIERGNWRKFNPYNPWTEDKTEKEMQDLKVESLDDLFDEPKKEEKKEDKKVEPKIKEEPKEIKKEVPKEDKGIDDLFDDIQINSEKPKQPEPAQVQEEEEDSYDLQKELEAKFDELFGSMDD
ncbi:MAG: type IV secretory system conjugative DNA transfer family protein [Clostridia bacterium]|jgi:type IV secretion system protein VirD4|nr:type IV secretory system conjugative DNA transfer family protein [Clostridia bacterium]